MLERECALTLFPTYNPVYSMAVSHSEPANTLPREPL